MKFTYILIGFLFLGSSSVAQIIGNVSSLEGSNSSVLPGVNVYWFGTTIGAISGPQGNFSIQNPEKYPSKLIFSFIGFRTDTQTVTLPNQKINSTLSISNEMSEVLVEKRLQSTKIDLLSTKSIETLSEHELTRGACCNVSEAFQTNASVDVVATDGVTGSKKIQMLGLDGIYTSIQAENIPYIRGLGNFGGLGHVPGTWVESIQIIKGTGSVRNGYEPMTGQINLEFWKPDELKEKIFVNLYSNAFGRMEANVHLGSEISKKWSTGLFLHGNTNQTKNDHNKDGFLDIPLKNELNMMNRWKYKSSRYMAQFGVQVLSENKQGGQLNYNPKIDHGSSNLYGTGAEAFHLQAFFKNGFKFKDHPGRSIAFFAKGNYMEQDYYMGLTTYKGNEKYFYLNYIYSDIINNTDHKYALGASFVFDEYNETFNAVDYNRSEKVPGVFGEYTYTGDKLGAVIGLRSDFHNLYGTQVNPKVNLKYKYSKLGVFRVSGGRGFRVANVFVENASTFVSQRTIAVQSNLQAEIAWNTGVSFTQKFEVKNRDMSIHGEYFYTDFENQVVVDRETSGQLSFYNLNGKSYSHAAQVEWSYQPWEVLEMRVAGKYLDVKTEFNSGLAQTPLIPNLRGMFTVGYETKDEKWQADFTTQFVGESRIPSTVGNKPENTVQTKSDPYALMSAQLTRRFNWWEVYVGGENLTNYKQPNAIISADQPFDSEFDASKIWGPVMGVNVYAGLRFRFYK